VCSWLRTHLLFVWWYQNILRIQLRVESTEYRVQLPCGLIFPCFRGFAFFSLSRIWVFCSLPWAHAACLERWELRGRGRSPCRPVVDQRTHRTNPYLPEVNHVPANYRSTDFFIINVIKRITQFLLSRTRICVICLICWFLIYQRDHTLAHAVSPCGLQDVSTYHTYHEYFRTTFIL
jgi:hypothetical protein